MITAIILAAGESRRMGQPKMLLPWGETTVLGHVIHTFRQAGIEDVLVVVGGAREQVQQIVNQHAARSVVNEDYEKGEMLLSLQRGITAQKAEAQATLIGLGDQPQVQAGTVRLISEAFADGKSKLIVPSFEMRRGHPWLVERSMWPELLALKAPQTLRDFLNDHAHAIQYVNIADRGILADLDTMQDYGRERP